jgi:hypothetical protein
MNRIVVSPDFQFGAEFPASTGWTLALTVRRMALGEIDRLNTIVQIFRDILLSPAIP